MVMKDFVRYSDVLRDNNVIVYPKRLESNNAAVQIGVVNDLLQALKRDRTGKSTTPFLANEAYLELKKLIETHFPNKKESIMSFIDGRRHTSIAEYATSIRGANCNEQTFARLVFDPIFQNAMNTCKQLKPAFGMEWKCPIPIKHKYKETYHSITLRPDISMRLFGSIVFLPIEEESKSDEYSEKGCKGISLIFMRLYCVTY